MERFFFFYTYRPSGKVCTRYAWGWGEMTTLPRFFVLPKRGCCLQIEQGEIKCAKRRKKWD